MMLFFFSRLMRGTNEYVYNRMNYKKMKPSLFLPMFLLFSHLNVQCGSNKKQQSSELHRELSIRFFIFIFYIPFLFISSSSSSSVFFVSCVVVVVAYNIFFWINKARKKLLHPDLFSFFFVPYTNTWREDILQSNKKWNEEKNCENSARHYDDKQT